MANQRANKKTLKDVTHIFQTDTSSFLGRCSIFGVQGLLNIEQGISNIEC
jgi:hypothetical protein